MIIKFNNLYLESEKIVKTSDSIIGYNENKEVFSFKGITDFSLFELIEGEYTNDGTTEEETEEDNTTELLQKIEENEREIALVWYEIAMGGI